MRSSRRLDDDDFGSHVDRGAVPIVIPPNARHDHYARLTALLRRSIGTSYSYSFTVIRKEISGMTRVRCSAAYADGVEYNEMVEVPDPSSLDKDVLEDWVDTYLAPHLGDGLHPDIDGLYEVEVLDSDLSRLIGWTWSAMG
jgi:hypothetical protein